MLPNLSFVETPALLNVHGSNTVPAPTERHTWALHLVVKDHFWDQATKGLVEAGSPSEYKWSDSSGELQDFQTLFIDNKDGSEIIPPRSNLRMRVEKEKVSFFTTNFVGKN